MMMNIAITPRTVARARVLSFHARGQIMTAAAGSSRGRSRLQADLG
ncbi:hypothetical protein [Demequina muriae]|uniref:Uncharacterized protein n=1 Tax=Demequina muriae TaxID=3051664 RepID=A0ABT8GDR7_9MICO|nr:hypothetical protein [Demequina sp. EGI L300058]MDN4479421.1 hypothetical protein [Demequina sp. EGI L300058]